MRSRRYRGLETVMVRRAGGQDPFGDSTSGEKFTDHHEESGCRIDWSGTSGAEDHRVISDVVLFCQPGADVLTTDRIRLPDGDEYQVDGKPAPWQSPRTGLRPGVVVKLKAVI